MSLSASIAGHEASRVALGGAGFSIRETQDEDAAVATIRAALDAGITQFDTARAYATVDDPLHNERLFARALAGEDVLIATKGGHFRVDATTWGADGTRAALRRDVEGSLRGLEVEHIGLYYLHKKDPETPLEESITALEELRGEGKIAAIGVCNLNAEQIELALGIAPISAVQNKFSPLETGDRSVLALCEERGIPFLAYSPLGGSARREALRERMVETRAITERRGVSRERVVLAWLLGLSPALSVITGAGRPASARDSAAALDLELAAEERAAIDAEVSAILAEG